MKTAIISGASGFIGSTLVNYLLNPLVENGDLAQLFEKSQELLIKKTIRTLIF